MNTIQKDFQQAQLAEAAYANLTSAIGNQDNLMASLDVKNKKVFGGDFSETQAKVFAAQWEVIDQLPDTQSGFSATLFKNRETGEYSFAIRGSTNLADFNADARLISRDGIAAAQLVDLYNYWQQLNTPAGQVYNAATRVIFPDGIYHLEFAPSSTLSDASLRLGTGKLTICPASLTVEGHSLGGHLAMAFTRLFPTINAHAVAVNGLGFKFASPMVESLFLQLNGADYFDPSRIQNIYGIAGEEFAAMNNGVLQQPGGWDGIFIESASFGTKGGHSVTQMTDSLAVYKLFACLSPALNNSADGLALLTGLLEASSSQSATSLENAVAALGQIFLGNKPIIPTDEREALYATLKEIDTALGPNPNPAFELIALTNQSVSSLLSLAQQADPTGLATRYALKAGNPFALIGVDYSAFNKNGELDLYDEASGTGMSAQYLKDRSEFLAVNMHSGTHDTTAIHSPDFHGLINVQANINRTCTKMPRCIEFSRRTACTISENTPCWAFLRKSYKNEMPCAPLFLR